VSGFDTVCVSHKYHAKFFIGKNHTFAGESENKMDKASAENIEANRKEYERLLKDDNYTNVRFNPENGGLMATHTEHKFDPNRGKYEKAVQEVGFNYGNSIIFGKEPGDEYKVKYTDGTWNLKQFEIAGKESATPKNIKYGLNHCAGKPNVQIAILYFPENNFDIHNFERGLAMYNGIGKSGGNGFKKFEQIICIEVDKIVYQKSHFLQWL
jgi:hypothetical protein